MTEQKPRLGESYGKRFTKTMALCLGWMILCTGLIERICGQIAHALKNILHII